MRLKIVGRGGAFAPISIGNSNFLLEEDGKFFLVDCGTTAIYILRDEWGFDLGDLDGLYLSHGHGDHVANVEQLAFWRYFIPNHTGKTVRPKLYASSTLMPSLWNETLKGGLESLHGRVASLTDYFECFPIQKNKSFVWQGIKFTPFATLHVQSGFSIKNSYGLYIENPKNGKRTTITGDTTFNPSGLNYFYENSDLVFHDCETTVERSFVHPNIVELRTLSPEIKAKLALYHYSKETDDKDFLCFCQKGQEFEI